MRVVIMAVMMAREGMRVVGVIGWGVPGGQFFPLPFSISSAFLVIAFDFGPKRTMLTVYTDRVWGETKVSRSS
jgi:hypothetical protein